jgi:Sulfotransferase domain
MTDVKRRAVSAVRRAAHVYEMSTATARALPTFLIIGAERAGTTSLYRYLGRHPQVMTVTLRRKGAHYFDTNFGNGARWYRSHFPTERAVHRRARHVGHVVTGEACPYYVFHPLVPERVRSLLPDARLILILRNPVSRAYSHFRHEVARGFEHLAFEDALEAEPKRLEGEDERMRSDPTYVSFPHQHFSYLARGHYLEQVMRWHAQFPTEQLLVADSGTFFADPDKGFREVERFLGITELSYSEYPRLNARSGVDMAPSTLERLHEHFAEPNRRLEEYLGRAFSWGT